MRPDGSRPADPGTIDTAPTRGRQPRRWLTAAWLRHTLLLLMTLAVVWVPELRHWYVRPTSLPADGVAAARSVPDAQRLHEIGQMQLRGLMVPADRLQATAEAITQGSLPLPGFATLPIGLPFRASDLEAGSPTWGLMFASLVAADTLIEAHRAGGPEAWFDLAREMIVAFARHEDARWLDQGLMWNDHATAARIPVLAKFWSLYRQRPGYDEATARQVLRLVSRSARLLARDDAYAWRTSHGVLSDLALLQVAAAFPGLPEAPMARQTALRRLQAHLPYWINAEGMTLLHSAGYHSGSLYHLSLMLRLSTLADAPIPADWWQRFDRAIDLEARLRRPDGSLPLLGDTLNLGGQAPPLVTARAAQGHALPLRPLVLAPVPPSAVFLPAAGHAVWLDGTAADGTPGSRSQTVLTWAYHEGLGHKLADELSVLLWSQGRSWITNIGYWPYGGWGRDLAEGWSGSNAPHLVGEKTDSRRSSSPLFVGSQGDDRFIELRREGPDGLAAHRQVLRLPALDAWLVLDHGQDRSAREVDAAWTFDAALSLRAAGGGDRFIAQAAGDRAAMHVALASSTGALPRTYKGSRSPFFGWMVVERDPRPASTLVQRRPSNQGWSMVGLQWTAEASDQTGPLTMQRWQGPAQWTAQWSTRAGVVEITRNGLQLQWQGAATGSMTLQAPDPGAAARAETQAALSKAAGQYRRFAEVVTYREKVSRWLLAAFAGQMVLLTALHLWRRRSHAVLHAILHALWAAGAAWLGLVYFF